MKNAEEIYCSKSLFLCTLNKFHELNHFKKMVMQEGAVLPVINYLDKTNYRNWSDNENAFL